jgi:hypothetical protein
VTTFVAATASYERWRTQRIPIVAADLEHKHERLAESPFVLLRGSYYRFIAELPSTASDVMSAPATIVVGDLHIENFGTWRDEDARLVWGVNDYDEIDLLPYTVDLVRLATSALLAIRADHLAIGERDAADAILAGWRARIDRGRPQTFVLAERHAHLYRLALDAFADPGEFAASIDRLEPASEQLPGPAARLIAEVTTWSEWKPSLHHRVAGVGSLGSQRFVAAGELAGGLLVREVKEIPGPAALWALPSHKSPNDLAATVVAMRGPAADPRRRQHGHWVVRPLAPDATRLELAAHKRRHDESDLLRSMGAEAANIHLTPHHAAQSLKAVVKDADARPDGWLWKAAQAMAALTERDHAEWSARTT